MSSAKSQIKLYNNNELHIGPLWWPTFQSTKQLFVNGGLEVREFPASGMFIQNYYNLWNGNWYNDPSIVSHFNNGGWVGTPTQRMFAVHTNFLYAAGVQITSDERFKKNIKRIEGNVALNKIHLIKSYTYDYNEQLYNNSDSVKIQSLVNSGRNQIGFLAQELKQVVPEVVCIDENTGQHSVNYMMLIPLLVEAINEQQKMINELKSQLLLNPKR